MRTATLGLAAYALLLIFIITPMATAQTQVPPGVDGGRLAIYSPAGSYPLTQTTVADGEAAFVPAGDAPTSITHQWGLHAWNMASTDCSTGDEGATWQVGYADDLAGAGFVPVAIYQNIEAGPIGDGPAPPGDARNLEPGCIFTPSIGNQVDVPAGKYIGILLTDGEDGSETVLGDDTYLIPAAAAAGMPVPNFGTIILLTVGLLMVAGAAYVRRKAE